MVRSSDSIVPLDREALARPDVRQTWKRIYVSGWKTRPPEEGVSSYGLERGDARPLPGKRRMTDVIDREQTNRDGTSQWSGSMTETEAAANSTRT